MNVISMSKVSLLLFLCLFTITDVLAQKNTLGAVDIFYQGGDSPYIRVKVNGFYGVFLLDTAAGTSALTERFSKLVGFENSGFVTTNFNGVLKTGVKIGSVNIEIAKVPIGSAEVIVVDSLAKDFPFYDGVIGIDALSKYDFSIDLKNMKLTLNSMLSESKRVSARSFFKDPPVVFMIGSCKFYFVLDTGTNITTFSKEAWEKVVKCEGVNEKIEQGRAHFKGVAKETFTQMERAYVPIRVLDMPVREMYVYQGFNRSLLGMDYLKDIKINYSGNGKFNFE